MGEGPIVWLAVFGGIVAAASAVACACACAWLARAARASSNHPPHHAAPRAGATTLYIPQAPAPSPMYQPGYGTVHAPVPMPVPVPVPVHAHHAPVVDYGRVQPMSMDRIPDHVVFDDAHAAPVASYAPMHAAPVQPAHARSPIVLEGRYPQLGAALGTWMQVEPDEVERIRIARDLGTIGGAGSARALLDGVRTGVLSPTIASDQLERGGFEAGIAVAAALRDPEPRVRALATSLVGRSTPLEPARMTQVPPMPTPPPHPPAPPSDPTA